MVFSLYICDRIIRVESSYGEFRRFCRGYLIKEPAPEPEISITVTDEEIEAQKALSGDLAK